MLSFKEYINEKKINSNEFVFEKYENIYTALLLILDDMIILDSKILHKNVLPQIRIPFFRSIKRLQRCTNNTQENVSAYLPNTYKSVYYTYLNFGDGYVCEGEGDFVFGFNTDIYSTDIIFSNNKQNRKAVGFDYFYDIFDNIPNSDIPKSIVSLYQSKIKDLIANFDKKHKKLLKSVYTKIEGEPAFEVTLDSIKTLLTSNFLAFVDTRQKKC